MADFGIFLFLSQRATSPPREANQDNIPPKIWISPRVRKKTGEYRKSPPIRFRRFLFVRPFQGCAGDNEAGLGVLPEKPYAGIGAAPGDGTVKNFLSAFHRVREQEG
jgi:hypothetical protein